MAHSQEMARKRLVQHQAVMENKWTGIEKSMEHRRERKQSQMKVNMLQKKLKMLQHETQHIKQKLRAERHLEECPHLKKEEQINEMIDLLHPSYNEMKAFRKESDDSMEILDHTLNHFNRHHHTVSPADHLRYIQSSLDKEFSSDQTSVTTLNQPPLQTSQENKVQQKHERKHSSEQNNSSEQSEQPEKSE